MTANKPTIGFSPGEEAIYALLLVIDGRLEALEALVGQHTDTLKEHDARLGVHSRALFGNGGPGLAAQVRRLSYLLPIFLAITTILLIVISSASTIALISLAAGG